MQANPQRLPTDFLDKHIACESTLFESHQLQMFAYPKVLSNSVPRQNRNQHSSREVLHPSQIYCCVETQPTMELDTDASSLLHRTFHTRRPCRN